MTLLELVLLLATAGTMGTGFAWLCSSLLARIGRTPIAAPQPIAVHPPARARRS